MLLRSLNYDIEVEYVPGTQQHLADMMSRSFMPLNSHESQKEFETVNAIKFVPMTEEKIGEIRRETEKDETLRLLRETIQSGFPEHKTNLSPQLSPYFHIRDELSVYNGIIFKGDRLVVPQKMRNEMKRELHAAHTGTEGCLRRARECVYWPGINAEIKEWISTCETCREYESAQRKEPLMSHEVVDRPWEKVGVDVLTYKGTDYLITVDYYSNYWEIDRLEDTKASTTIRKLKAHFARFGIPTTLVSDNGTNFTADTFQRFTREWGINHTPSSPHHSQSNGKVEAAVKAAKSILRKTDKTREDQYLALLAVRNTPSQGIGRSPVQRLINRRTRTRLPTTDTLLQPRIVEKEAEQSKMRQQQHRQAHYYDRSARELPPLATGETVRLKPFKLGDKSWKKGSVVARLYDRSYIVENSEETRLRRNRVYLRKTSELPVTQQDGQDIYQQPPEDKQEEIAGPDGNEEQQTVTCSGRRVRRPAYLNEYV